MVLVLVERPCSWHSHGFEVEGLCPWGVHQGPIENLPPKQVEVLYWGQLGYENADMSHGASTQPVAEHFVEEYRRGHREI